MIPPKDMFNFKAILAIAIVLYFVSPSTADTCTIWCDSMTLQTFLDCVCADIRNNPKFANIPVSSLDDLKRSILAASSSITKSSEAAKMSMMNGAMAGELAELIKFQSKYNREMQDPDATATELMFTVEKCCVQTSGQKGNFSMELRKIVNFLLKGFLAERNNSSTAETKYAEFADFRERSIQPPNNDDPIPVPRQQNTFSFADSRNSFSNQENSRITLGEAYNKPLPYQNFPATDLQNQNIRQNYRDQIVTIQGRAINVPPVNQPQNSASDAHSFNQQKIWNFNAPNTDIQALSQKNKFRNMAEPNYLNNGKNNQPYAGPGKNIQQAYSTAIVSNVPSSQNLNTDGRTISIDQEKAYARNKVDISTLQNNQSISGANTADLYNEPQPINDSKYPASIDSSSAITNSIANNAAAAASGSLAASYPSNTDTQRKVKPDLQPRRRNLRRRKRRRNYSKSSNKEMKLTDGDTQQSLLNGNDNDIARAKKFSRTIHDIFFKSGTFRQIYNEQLSNNKAVFLAEVIQNALNDCGYPTFAAEIAKAYIVSIKSLPEQSSSARYAKIFSKSLTSQFYKKRLIGDNPKILATRIANCILALLKQSVLDGPSTSTERSDLPSMSSSTDSAVTATISDDLTTEYTIAPVSFGVDIEDADGKLYEEKFYETLFWDLSTNKHFTYAFNIRTANTDAISWAARMLSSYLSEVYDRKVTTATVHECVKRMHSLKSCTTAVYAKVIAKCVSDLFSYYGLISPHTPATQASDIAAKCNRFLIKLIKLNNQATNDNAPNYSLLQDTNDESSASSSSPSDTNDKKTGVQNVPKNPKAKNNRMPPRTVNSGSYSYNANDETYYYGYPDAQNSGNDNNDMSPNYKKPNQPDGKKNNSELSASSSSSSNRFSGSALIEKNKKYKRKQKGKMVDSSTNAISNSATAISQQNNGDYEQATPENRDSQSQLLKENRDSSNDDTKSNWNTDKTPSQAQIISAEKSAESKERINILMEWAISSMQNRKFNYKLFSNIISGLTKYVQKSHPELGSQEALFKILIETITALIQLLTQAPQDCFENKYNNFENPNVPNTEHFSSSIFTPDQTSMQPNGQSYPELKQSKYNIEQRYQGKSFPPINMPQSYSDIKQIQSGYRNNEYSDQGKSFPPINMPQSYSDIKQIQSGHRNNEYSVGQRNQNTYILGQSKDASPEEPVYDYLNTEKMNSNVPLPQMYPTKHN